jgi:lysylphosphatidylglycerol synthetase-like protein (DUF2156 family)
MLQHNIPQMNPIADISHRELPLSWRRTTADLPAFSAVPLPFSGAVWIPFADIPFHYPFSAFYKQVLATLDSDFVIRGCSPAIAAFLRERGCEAVAVGSEAILDLAERHVDTGSIRQLVRRGLRHGRCVELRREAFERERFVQFMQTTRHYAKPQLAYLFRNGFDDLTRCFVFETPHGHWLAGLTLSQSNIFSFHTELILRRPDAPIGVMESLIAHVFETLRQEGFRRWSLGEVPFHSPAALSDDSSLIRRAGRLFQFAYDAAHLFEFKDKFSPLWQPVYLCARPSINWRMLCGLSLKTNYARLVLSQLPQLIHY